MGAGILPIAFNGFNLVFLLGQEKTGQWSDFGGSSNNRYETKFKTAIREGYEELNGLLGDKHKMAIQIKNNYIGQINDDRYTTFAFKTDYDTSLPIYFKRNYNFIEKTTPYLIDMPSNGLYEKKNINWFTSNEIYNLELRPFYKKVIFKILQNEKKIEKLFEYKYSCKIYNNYEIESGNDFS